MNKSLLLILFVTINLLLVSNASALFTTGPSSVSDVNYQSYPTLGGSYSAADVATYWPILDQDSTACRDRQDILLQVNPVGCQPAVVRSDLLGEQNVPVLCQLDALEVNPLLDIKSIDSITFQGTYPKEVASTGFYPARAALTNRDQLLSNPLINNVGYVVVVLRKNANESSLPDFVSLNLTARVQYDAYNAFGIGQASFILGEQNDADFANSTYRQSFWQGRYSVKADQITSDYATISIYYGDRKLTTTQVKRGTSSSKIFIPGFSTCQASMQIAYDGYENSGEDRARIEISDVKGTDVFDVYRGMQFANGKCTVSSVNVNADGSTGDVTVSCGGSRVDLSLAKSASTSDNAVKDVILVKEADGKTLNFGSVDHSVSNEDLYTTGLLEKGETLLLRFGDGYSLKLTSSYKKDDKTWDTLVTRTASGAYQTARVLSTEANDHLYATGFIDKTDAIVVRFNEGTTPQVTATAPTTVISATQTQAQTDYLNYVQQALTQYKQVVDSYPSETAVEGGMTYGEQALRSALDLAYDSGLDSEYQNLLSVYKQKYPQSDLTYYTSRVVSGVDRSNSVKVVNLDNTFSTIKLLSLTKANTKPSLDVSVNGARKLVTLTKSASDASQPGPEIDSLNSGNSKTVRRITLTGITPEQVTIHADCPATYTTARDITMTKGQTQTICDQTIHVNSITADKVAVVRILPNVQNTNTETNLSVKIGIEKRAIQLSPEKAKSMIDNLNKSIQKWDSISSGLGKAVTGLKTACFATAAVLTAKNFISGLDGTALARKQVMEGDKGWSAKCTAAFKDKSTISGSGTPYVSVDDCLRQNAQAIDADVAISKNIITEKNDRLEEQDANFKKDTSTFGSAVDTEKSAQSNIAYLKSTYKNDAAIGGIVNSLSDTSYKDGTITYDQMKSLEYDADVLKSDASSTMKEAAQSNINDIKKSVDASLAQQKSQAAFKSSIGNSYSFSNMNVFKSKDSSTGDYSGSVYDASKPISGFTSVDSGTPIEQVNYNGNQYLVTLSTDSTVNGQRTIKDVYSYDSTLKTASSIDSKLAAEIKSKFPVFTQSNENTYKNVYKNPEVKFYETAPSKGTPSVVPVDTREGWYAGTQQVLPVLGQESSVQTSGKVSSFWLCNVGPNGVEEFDKSNFGDDICQQFNFYTGQATNKFPGLPDSKTQTLVTKAVARLNQAAKQYSSGVSQVLFDNNERIKVGSPSVGVPTARCQDYMSPKECQLLFNVCDPVICPSSRCNLGGQYYVSNVPETGIVGSALLCLPNAKEGIAVPVCLTGIQAGVDSFVSIMKSHRDCLAEQLETGQTVGICDQIYSVYMCEFFWRQMAPIANAALPKLIASAYSGGQNSRGGAEYLTVMNAWQQTQNSISYFTQEYAVNSLQAFKVRSADEAGSAFCKAFASIKAPTSASLKSLVQPDSPPQFNAWFSSTKFNDVVVPAISQYKVFYHIFAGKDSGVSYQVYLKNSEGTSFYNTPTTVMVATGFITKGDYASETKDFTAPEGYKELCVRINGDEQCGFQQVSTSFAENYITDQTRSAQLTQTDITTEQGCISGSVGSSISLSANIQSTVESVVAPQVYEAGIVRICGKLNPGQSTDPSRYQEVGYCGQTEVKCWLDTQSISRALSAQDAGVRNSTLATLNSTAAAAVAGTSTYLGDDEIAGTLSSISEDIAALLISTSSSQDIKTQGAAIISRIDAIAPQVGLNHQLAQLRMLRGDAFKAVSARIRPIASSPSGTNAESSSSGNSGSGTSSASSQSNSATASSSSTTSSGTGSTASTTSSGNSISADVTFGDEFLKNAKKICLIDDSTAIAPAAGLASGSAASISDSVLAGVAASPTVTLSTVDEALVAGKVIAERSGDLLVKYNGVWKSIPKSSVIAPSLVKLSPLVTSAGSVVAGGLNGWGAVCSGVNVYLAYDAFNQMSVAADQAAASAQAYENQMQTFTQLPKNTLYNIQLMRAQLTYLSTISNDNQFKQYCPSISSANVQATISAIDALPSKLSLDANSIANVYDGFMTNTESTTEYVDPISGVSSTVNSVIDDATGSKISLEEGRKLSGYVKTWYASWIAAGGKDLLTSSQQLTTTLYSCIGLGKDVQNTVQDGFDLAQALKQLESKSGTYSDNKDLIDQMHDSMLLTDEEYTEINGEGLTNLEENVEYVRDILLTKMLIEDTKLGKTTQISLVSATAPSNLADQYSEGKIRQLSVDGARISVFAAGYGDLSNGNSRLYISPYGSGDSIGAISQNIVYIENKAKKPSLNGLNGKSISSSS